MEQFEYLKRHGLLGSLRYGYYRDIHKLNVYHGFKAYIKCTFHYIKWGLENKQETQNMLNFFKIKQRW